MKAVAACKCPPEGIRDCGSRRPIWYRSFTEYVREANERVVVVVQIETVNALRNLSELLSVPGVDDTMLGPADLSASLGYLGYPNEPRVVGQ